MNRIIMILLLCLTVPLTAQALPTIECHCFQDRSYDMAKPGAADDYFLTATQNTFFALTFDVTKKIIVGKKQRGASGADLWVAYWLADKSATEVEKILTARSQQSNWAATITALGIKPTALGTTSNSTLNDATAPLDHVVVDEVLERLQILSADDLKTLRHNNASNKELLVCALLANKSDNQPLLFLQQVQGHVATWDSLMTHAGIDIQNIEQVLLTTFATLKKG
ncbi:MAG: hypothetical protein JRG71_06505 [Deltaproteobacteria bacterium]|nr:hypothetical protein [Deltaproteobacteria bacterium]